MRINCQKNFLGLYLLLIVGVVCGCRDQVSFEYTYARPEGLSELPEQLPLSSTLLNQEERIAAGERRVQRLAQALGIPLDTLNMVQRVDSVEEVMRLSYEQYRFKVYLPSGMISFRDTTLYNSTSEAEAQAGPLSEDEAVELARTVSLVLIDAGLVNESELLFEAPRISFRKEGEVAGAVQGQQGRPQLQPSRRMDARVFVARVLVGVGVSGQGIRFTFSNTGRLTGLDFLWRELRLDHETSYALRMDMAGAMNRFEQSIDVPAESNVNVLVNELVYYDPSMRDPLNYLEPVYLFVYVVKTPIRDQDEFIVSKKLHHVIPAVEHSGTQLVPPRERRYEQLQRLLGGERPVEPPLIEQTDEDEEVGQ